MNNIIPLKMNKISSFLVILLFILIPLLSIGQSAPTPPEPPSCITPGEKGVVGDNGAPLSEGAWLMVGLAFAYGAYEFWKAKKRAKGSSEA